MLIKKSIRAVDNQLLINIYLYGEIEFGFVLFNSSANIINNNIQMQVFFALYVIIIKI